MFGIPAYEPLVRVEKCVRMRSRNGYTELLLAKRALFDEYVDDVCMDISHRLTEEELFGLLDLPRV